MNHLTQFTKLNKLVAPSMVTIAALFLFVCQLVFERNLNNPDFRTRCGYNAVRLFESASFSKVRHYLWPINLSLEVKFIHLFETMDSGSLHFLVMIGTIVDGILGMATWSSPLVAAVGIYQYYTHKVKVVAEKKKLLAEVEVGNPVAAESQLEELKEELNVTRQRNKAAERLLIYQACTDKDYLKDQNAKLGQTLGKIACTQAQTIQKLVNPAGRTAALALSDAFKSEKETRLRSTSIKLRKSRSRSKSHPGKAIAWQPKSSVMAKPASKAKPVSKARPSSKAKKSK